jgi:hypothetical protein
MMKYIIFYRLAFEYDKVLVNADSLSDAVATADSFSRKTGAVIVGVCPELLLNVYCHG